MTAYAVTSAITGTRTVATLGSLAESLAWRFDDTDDEIPRVLRALDDALTFHPRRNRREIRRLCRYLRVTLDAA